MNAIQDAILIFGSVTDMAKALGVTPQAVAFWRDGERKVPAGKAPLIERLTHGVIPCERLCPDVDWDYIRKSGRNRNRVAKALQASSAIDQGGA